MRKSLSILPPFEWIWQDFLRMFSRFFPSVAFPPRSRDRVIPCSLFQTKGTQQRAEETKYSASTSECKAEALGGDQGSEGMCGLT